MSATWTLRTGKPMSKYLDWGKKNSQAKLTKNKMLDNVKGVLLDKQVRVKITVKLNQVWKREIRKELL